MNLSKVLLRGTYMHFLHLSGEWVHVCRMYAVYRQAHTPTAVEFSVYCNFISSKEKNLVVAGTSQLFVYRIIHDAEVPVGMGDVKDVAFYPLDVEWCSHFWCISEHVKNRQVIRYVQATVAVFIFLILET